MSVQGTLETRLYDAERQIAELSRRLATVDARPAAPRLYHDDNLIPFRNGTAGEIPAYGVMRMTGASTANGKVIVVGQPNGTRQRCFLINGPTAVAASAYGWARMNSPTAYALYDTAAGAPAYGEIWFSTNSSWKLTKDATLAVTETREGGFLILGGAVDGRVLVKHFPSYGWGTSLALTDNQTIAAGGTTTLTGTATATYAGDYTIFVSVAIEMAAGAAGSWYGEILKNGTALGGSRFDRPYTTAITGNDSAAWAKAATLAAGDAIRVRIKNNFASDISTGTSSPGESPGAIILHGVSVRG